jgi:MoaA/NifB/PqqE/SkfB family radical SAM enzyme
MPVINLNLATRGMDSSSKWKILKRHMFSFLKHMTPKKFINFSRAELNRIKKKEVLNSYPYILKIESTNICNLHCAFCYDGRRMPTFGERTYGRMTLDNFKKLIDEVGPYLFKINLYGYGEPLLFPETLEMIQYASKNNVGIGISSNLNFRDQDLPRHIVVSGLEVLIFSCHGVTQESYSKFMVKGNLQLALENVRKIVEERKRIGSSTPLIDWQYCVTKLNEGEMDMAVAKANELGVDQIRFVKPNLPEDADDEWFADYFKEHAPVKLQQNKAVCTWPYRSAYINYDGGLRPCCQADRLLANDFGNVFISGFMNVWNNEKYRSSRRLIANPTDKNIICNTVCSRCVTIGTANNKEIDGQ